MSRVEESVVAFRRPTRNSGWESEQQSFLIREPHRTLPQTEFTLAENAQKASRRAPRTVILKLVPQPSTISQPSPDATGFAGLLAALAAPKPEPESAQEQSWADGLADDVATLSHERAPRTATETKIEKTPHDAHDRATRIEQTRKRASITLRMSQAECAQLQQRAAEAGLTVSAYIRSCTFEVESLRAEVKQAVAELRAAKVNGDPAAASHPQRFHLFWHSRRQS